MQNNRVNESLLRAVRAGNLAEATGLIDQNVNINYVDEFRCDALYYSITHQSADIFKYLVEIGADLGTKYKDKRSILQVAVRTGSEEKGLFEIIKILIEREPDIDYRDMFGNTALFYACISYTVNRKTIQMLLENGADQDIRNEHGFSAFTSAQEAKRTELLQILEKYR